MVKPIQRLGDSNSAGGKVANTDGNSTVYANSLLASVDTSLVRYPRSSTATSSGSGTVSAHGKPVNYTDNPDVDGNVRIGGSGDVFVGDDIDQDIPSIRLVVEAEQVHRHSLLFQDRIEKKQLQILLRPETKTQSRVSLQAHLAPIVVVLKQK